MVFKRIHETAVNNWIDQREYKNGKKQVIIETFCITRGKKFGN